MTVDRVFDLFFALKEARDNYNENQEASLLLVNRLSVLKDPIMKFHSQELRIPQWKQSPIQHRDDGP